MTSRPLDAPLSSPEAAVRKIPVRRQILYVVTIWLAFFLVAEIGARVGGFIIYGFSPYYLLYGISSFMADADPQGHSAAYDGYFKFPPSRTLHQYGLFKQPTPIWINAHGLRGPEFTSQKPDSVIRIICLGESSTFGFYDRDEGTYPAILSRLLNGPADSGRGPRYEVINAGIPHVNSDNIRALVEHEILGYGPDLLTLYAGYNDASMMMAPSTLQKTMTWIHGHFASYVAFKALLMKLGGPELPSRWSAHVAGADSSYVNQQIRLQTQRYRNNVESIVTAAEAKGAQVILIKQALSPHWVDSTHLTYQEKIAAAAQSLSRGGKISKAEATMVVHSALMDVLDSLAKERSLKLVDNIAIINMHPEYLASYVHISETGNLALAEAIRAALLTPTAPENP